MPTRTNDAAPLPTAADLARQLGIELQPALGAVQIKRLRRALPGYVALLDDVADLLERDGAALNLADIKPGDLRAMQKQHRQLAQAEAVLEAAHTSAYHQRLSLDSEAMGLLQKMARRVQSRAEEDPQLPVRWKLLLDFLGTFRGGGRPAAEPDAPEPTPAAPTPGG